MTATVTRLRSSRCTRTPRRHLPPTEAEILRQDITAVCAQADRRLGNPLGTAERGIYFWYWPASSVSSINVLTRLHADAVAFLHTLSHPCKEGQFVNSPGISSSTEELDVRPSPPDLRSRRNALTTSSKPRHQHTPQHRNLKDC